MLIKKSRIQKAIQAAFAKRNANTELTQEYVLKSLRRIAEETTNDSAGVKALELVGKHMGMFWEPKPSTPPVPANTLTPLDISVLPLDLRKQILAYLHSVKSDPSTPSTTKETTNGEDVH
jgi:hypothetical protein